MVAVRTVVAEDVFGFALDIEAIHEFCGREAEGFVLLGRFGQKVRHTLRIFTGGMSGVQNSHKYDRYDDPINNKHLKLFF